MYHGGGKATKLHPSPQVSVTPDGKIQINSAASTPATVIQADIAAGPEALVHVIDGVLIPPGIM